MTDESRSGESQPKAICEAETAGYDGWFGVYCGLPEGHDGPHDDGHVRWEFVGKDPWRKPKAEPDGD